jgi:hypothetical protein
MTEDVGRFGGGTLKVDRTLGRIKDVKILGFKSLNGRRYTPEAVKSAAKLYEGAMVNIDHPEGKPTGQRSAYDRFGKLVNIRYVEGEGLFGDLEYLTKHPMALRVAEAAERMPELYGMSHNAEGEGEDDDEGIFVVNRITEVRHVDLVADPATTKSLSESRRILREEELGDKVKRLNTVRDRITGELKSQEDRLIKAQTEYGKAVKIKQRFLEDPKSAFNVTVNKAERERRGQEFLAKPDQIKQLVVEIEKKIADLKKEKQKASEESVAASNEMVREANRKRNAAAPSVAKSSNVKHDGDPFSSKFDSYTLTKGKSKMKATEANAGSFANNWPLEKEPTTETGFKINNKRFDQRHVFLTKNRWERKGDTYVNSRNPKAKLTGKEVMLLSDSNWDALKGKISGWLETACNCKRNCNCDCKSTKESRKRVRNGNLKEGSTMDDSTLKDKLMAILTGSEDNDGKVSKLAEMCREAMDAGAPPAEDDKAAMEGEGEDGEDSDKEKMPEGNMPYAKDDEEKKEKTEEGEEEEPEDDKKSKMESHRRTTKESNSLTKKVEALQLQLDTAKRTEEVRELCESVGLPVSKALISDLLRIPADIVERHAKRLAIAAKAAKPRSGVPVVESAGEKIPSGLSLGNFLTN